MSRRSPIFTLTASVRGRGRSGTLGIRWSRFLKCSTGVTRRCRTFWGRPEVSGRLSGVGERRP